MTEQEIKDIELSDLKLRRKIICFEVVNRGTAWYNTLTVEQYDELVKWYNEWLNVTDTLVEPTTPEWLND